MTAFSSASRTTAFRYVRVSWPGFDELGDLPGVTGCSVEENMESTLKASGTLSLKGGWEPASMDEMVRVYSLSSVPGEPDESVCHGTFMVSAPRTGVDSSSSTEADLYSVLKILRDARLTDSLSMAKGTATVAFAASLVRSARLAVVTDPSAHRVASAHSWDVGTALLDVVNDCLGWAGFSSASVDGYGNVVMRIYVDPSGLSPVARLSDSERGGPLCGVSLVRDHDPSSVPNVSVVVYSPSEGEPQRAVVRNDDPASPFSTVSRSREIVRCEEVSELSGSASALALQNLRTAMRVVDRYEAESLWWPCEVGDALTLDYRGLGGPVACVLVGRSVQMTPALRCTLTLRRTVDYFEATGGLL